MGSTPAIEALLVQYRVFADRRLHFGHMYWLNIAFVLAAILAAAALFGDVEGSVRKWLYAGAGIAALQTGVIAYRLQSIEDDYERLMADIERKLATLTEGVVLQAPLSKRFGARTMATTSLFALAAVLLIAAALA